MKTTNVAETIAKDYYCIPNWCRMHPFDHFDGMGGCLGVSSGQVLANGEKYCLNCDYYKNNVGGSEKQVASTGNSEGSV